MELAEPKAESANDHLSHPRKSPKEYLSKAPKLV